MEWAAIVVVAVVLGVMIRQQRLQRDRQKQLKKRLLRLEDELRTMRAGIFAGSVERALAQAGRTARMPIEFCAQNGEDAFLWELFGGQLDGQFIEVGAANGKLLSVSYVFEAVGWRGWLIEPVPEACEECRNNRPNSVVVHAALSRAGSSGVARFTEIVGAQDAKNLSYLETNTPHEQRLTRSKMKTKTVEVPLRTMDDVLGEHPGVIDFASIDVEGGELALLQGFDLKRHKPRVLVIEDLSHGKDHGVGDHVLASGYVRLGRLHQNDVYIHASETTLLERGRGMKSWLWRGE